MMLNRRRLMGCGEKEPNIQLVSKVWFQDSGNWDVNYPRIIVPVNTTLSTSTFKFMLILQYTSDIYSINGDINPISWHLHSPNNSPFLYLNTGVSNKNVYFTEDGFSNGWNGTYYQYKRQHSKTRSSTFDKDVTININWKSTSPASNTTYFADGGSYEAGSNTTFRNAKSAYNGIYVNELWVQRDLSSACKSCSIKKLQIDNNNQTLIQLVPALNLSTGIYGLYDTINDMFYYKFVDDSGNVSNLRFSGN